MSHKLNTVLYHGTISEISRIDVTLGRGRKDFGRGFYMAVTKQQAVGMMHKKYREAVRRSRAKQESNFTEKLYQITLNEDMLSSLNIKIFEEADEEWLDFILMCREKGGTPHAYDLVIGPVANDQAIRTVNNYLKGYFNEDIAIQLLLPQNLKDQFAFKTENALSILEFSEVKFI